MEILNRLNTALEGRYRVEQELGQGGMATVFLAQDLKHNRQVAVKVLKPELAAVVGAERFLAEIETTANLQHPHILPLYDSGEADSFLFYVMPYVEGESLADRLKREQQLPVDDALRITKAIAGALDYAHRQGVVHRDIKPANILLHEGEPMVADFGIALAVSQAGDGRITETGLSLGTPHYMSPEQAAGERSLDKRSDVYALGCVLYEMLTGQPPFGGPNAQAVLGRILTGDPDPVTSHRRAVPPNVEAAVHKSLERLPADRFESAGALVRAIEDPGFTTTVGTVTRGGAVAEARWRRRFLVAGAVAVILGFAAVAGWLRDGGEADAEPVRFTQELPFAVIGAQFAVSPDGSSIVVTDRNGANVALGGDARQSVVRQLGQVEFRDLEADGAVVHPAFSPDGRALAITSPEGEIRVIPVGGGIARTVASTSPGPAVAWGDDGFIYFWLPDYPGIGRVPQSGGSVDTVLVMEEEGVALSPHAVLPGGRALLFGLFSVARGEAETWIVDLENGERRALFPGQGARAVTYSPTGHILYASGRFLMAQAIDPRSLELIGSSVPVAEVPTGAIGFAYGGGTLVYAGTGAGADLRPVLVDRSGRRTELPNLPDGSYAYPEVAPDGRRFAIQRAGGTGGDVWVYEMPDGPLTRVSLAGEASTASWTDDGEHLLYIAGGDAWRARSDGSGDPELILDRERPLSRIVPGTNDRLFFQEGPPWDVGTATLGVEGSDSLILDGAGYAEGHPVPSPDGRWLAHYSDESGRVELYVRPLDGAGRRRQISRNGGSRPRWSGDGTELFFAGGVSRPTLMVASLEIGDGLEVLGVEPLVTMADPNYDIFPDDSTFLILTAGDDESAVETGMTVVLNFDTVLRRAGEGGTE